MAGNRRHFCSCPSVLTPPNPLKSLPADEAVIVLIVAGVLGFVKGFLERKATFAAGFATRIARFATLGAPDFRSSGVSSMPIARREILSATVLSAVGMILGCKEEEQPSSTATLLHNRAVQESLLSMSGAVSDVMGQVDRLDSENWREVVPDLKDSAGALDSAYSALRKSLGVDS